MLLCLCRERPTSRLSTKSTTEASCSASLNKDSSVFAPWKVDNSKEILAGFVKDISRWKVARFVKDEEDLKHVYQVMEQHVFYLKTMYIILISMSNYPSVTWNDFTTFVNS
mmetsp:Transcript_33658/g.38729  ORF Transcript_33658/g.38729 Transcript_33658/m.38729 type:complete len:111 (-) Transcript_33658:7-339(-)